MKHGQNKSNYLDFKHLLLKVAQADLFHLIVVLYGTTVGRNAIADCLRGKNYFPSKIHLLKKHLLVLFCDFFFFFSDRGRKYWHKHKINLHHNIKLLIIKSVSLSIFFKFIFVFYHKRDRDQLIVSTKILLGC